MNKQSSIRTEWNSTASRLTIPAAVFAIASQGFAQSYTVVELGTLGGPQSFASDINNAGQITGETSSKENPEVAIAFLWENGVMIDIGTLGNSTDESYAAAINNLAQISGTSEPVDVSWRAFRWQDGRMENLGTLGGIASYGQGINDLGDVVGWSHLPGPTVSRPVLWSGDKIVDLGVLEEGHDTRASGINNFQEVVGSGYLQDVTRGFIWQDGIMSLLPNLIRGDEASSAAGSINDNGWISGYARANDGSQHPVIWLSKNFPDISIVDLGLPEEFFSGFSHDLNNMGQVVGNYWDGCGKMDGCPYPFIWENGQSLLLDDLIPNDSGWKLYSASAINDLGQIVGIGLTPNEEYHGFLLNPIIPGDLNGDLVVNTSDLLILFSNWGPCVNCNDCPADLDEDCAVGTNDLLLLFSNWG